MNNNRYTYANLRPCIKDALEALVLLGGMAGFYLLTVGIFLLG